MVIRIASFDNDPTTTVDKKLMDEFRSWMKSQPGFRASWHARDSKTGGGKSVSVWDDMASLVAMKDRTFPGGALGFKPDKVEVFDEVEEF